MHQREEGHMRETVKANTRDTIPLSVKGNQKHKYHRIQIIFNCIAQTTSDMLTVAMWTFDILLRNTLIIGYYALSCLVHIWRWY